MVDGQRRVLRTALQIVRHLLEYPRTTERGSAYHHCVNAIAVESVLCLLRRADVTIADNGNVDTGIVLHLAYKSPVGIARIHLGTGATVYGKSLNATVLQRLSEVADDQLLRVPTQSGLYRYRCLHRFYHLTRYLKQQRDVLKHTGAGSLTSHFLHRTTEVDVYNVRLCLLHDASRLHHRVDVATVNLYAYRTLLVADGKLAQRGVDGAHKSLGAHKLSVDHRRAITLAKMAKANVRNVFHRSKEERMRTKFDVSYFHFFFVFFRF